MDVNYEKLLDALVARVATKGVVTPPPTTVYGHGGIYGQGGAFSFPGLERDVVNAMIMPRLGLIDRIPSRTANTDNPLYGLMTGVTATQGSEPEGPCADPPVAGMMKMCTHSFVWGRFSRMTRVFELDRFGRIRDRSDFTDLNLIGDPLAVGMNPWMPTTPAPSDPAQALKTELAKALFEFAVAWGRDFSHMTYTGNPANNIDQGYKEPYGLDILINDGYRDAETGNACPAADSIIADWGSAEIRTNGQAFVRLVTSIYRNLKYVAERAGLAPAKWAITMPMTAFYEITEIWPCAYNTYRCQSTGTFDAAQVAQTNSGDLITMRDAMRQGSYLLIDGEQVPVIQDDGVVQTPQPGGSFIGSMYFVPLTILGGRPATFLEYFNYDAPGAAMEAAKLFAPQGSYFTTNGGRFLWHAKPPANFCVQMLAKTEWRVILETPHIAARIDNLKWTPLIPFRSPFPDDTSYYVDGGGYTRDAYDLSYFTPTDGQAA